MKNTAEVVIIGGGVMECSILYNLAQQGLNGADVGAVFEEMGGERVAERVGGDSLEDPGAAACSSDRALDAAAVEVVTTDALASRVPGESWRR